MFVLKLSGYGLQNIFLILCSKVFELIKLIEAIYMQTMLINSTNWFSVGLKEILSKCSSKEFVYQAI